MASSGQLQVSSASAPRKRRRHEIPAVALARESQSHQCITDTADSSSVMTSQTPAPVKTDEKQCFAIPGPTKTTTNNVESPDPIDDCQHDAMAEDLELSASTAVAMTSKQDTGSRDNTADEMYPKSNPKSNASSTQQHPSTSIMPKVHQALVDNSTIGKRTNKKIKKKKKKRRTSVRSYGPLHEWNGSDRLTIGHKLKAMDFTGVWYSSRIVEERSEDDHVCIHFDGWNSKFDVWFTRDSECIRPFCWEETVEVSVIEDVTLPSEQQTSEPVPVKVEEIPLPLKESSRGRQIKPIKRLDETDNQSSSSQKRAKIKKAVRSPESKRNSASDAVTPLRKFYGFQKPPSKSRCALCNEIGDGVYGQGELLGPFIVLGKKCYVHNMCMVWSPTVVEDAHGNLTGVDKAIISSRKSECSFCNEPGATINCCVDFFCRNVNKACSKRFHYRCMIASGALPCVRKDSFKCICREHVECMTPTKLTQKFFKCHSLTCQSPSIQDLLYCITCGSRWHSGCVSIDLTDDIEKVRDGWQCMACKQCSTCHKDDNENQMLICSSCDKGWHTYCLDIPTNSIPKGEWKCSDCVKCKDCGTRKSKRWCKDSTLCFGCYMLHLKGRTCPVCNIAYRENDKNMVCCDTCGLWVHNACDNITDEVYKYMNEENRSYDCPKCVQAKIQQKKDELALVVQQVKAASLIAPTVINESLNSVRKKKSRQTLIAEKDLLPPAGVTVSEMAAIQLKAIGFEDQHGKTLDNLNASVCVYFKDSFCLQSDLCKVCGSRGLEDEGLLIFCTQCGEGYHPFCIGVDKKSIPKLIANGWRCMDCLVCSVCDGNNSEDLILVCDDCDRGCHTFCCNPPLKKIPTGAWKCDRCVICKDCGATESVTWSRDYTTCKRCMQLRARDKVCPVCISVILDTEDATTLLQCTTCERAVHSNCEELSESVVESIQRGECLMNCARCRLNDDSLPRWKIRSMNIKGTVSNITTNQPRRLDNDISRSIKDTKSDKPAIWYIDKVDSSYKGIMKSEIDQQEEMNSNQKFHGEQNLENNNFSDRVAEDECRHQLSDRASPELKISNESSDNADTQPQAKEHSQINSSVSFLKGFKSVVSQRLVHLRKLSSLQNISEQFLATNTNFNEVTGSCIVTACTSQQMKKSPLVIKLKANPNSPQALIRSAGTRRPVYHRSPQMSTIKISSERVAEATDVRRCALCPILGDGERQLGRMLNVDVDQWVHVNCARWAPETYEREDGGIEGVQKAIRRSKSSLPCVGCSQKHATVGCDRKSCSRNYHFKCALDAGCVFLSRDGRSPTGGRMVCRECAPKYLQTVGKRLHEVTNFICLEHMYIIRDERSVRQKAQIGAAYMRVGALTILSMGEVEFQHDSFHTKTHIFPKGFKTRRLFWSMRRYNQRAIYAFEIVVQGERPIFMATSFDYGYKPIVIRSKSGADVWNEIQKRVNQLRSEVQTTNMAFPKLLSTLNNPEIHGLDLFGFSPLFVHWIEDLPGSSKCKNYRYHLLLMKSKPLESLMDAKNIWECARTRPFDLRALSRAKFLNRAAGETAQQMMELKRNHNVFGNEDHEDPTGKRDESPNPTTDLPLSMQYRKLASTWKNCTYVFKSMIQGWGLIARTRISKGDMIIEYIGQVVRKQVSEYREAMYQSKGIGCYMFGIENSDYVVDATMCGNSARFINHGCDPNCHSKLVYIDGQPKIIIFALRVIEPYEELVYDYKFELDEADKIQCGCGAKNCVGWMN